MVETGRAAEGELPAIPCRHGSVSATIEGEIRPEWQSVMDGDDCLSNSIDYEDFKQAGFFSKLYLECNNRLLSA